MRSIPFKVFPSVGFRNSQFQIVGFVENLSVSIKFGGKTIHQIDLDGSNPGLINNLSHPGIYTVSCGNVGEYHSQSFEVKDSIRIGSSEFKKAYTFEGIPYTFFVRRDRMIIYDENRNQEYEENHISPTDIKKLDEHHLLFITKFTSSRDSSHITNYAVYSLKEFQINFELVDKYQQIIYLEEEKLLWLFNNSQKIIHCFCLDSSSKDWLQEINALYHISDYKLVNNSVSLYADAGSTIFIIDLSTQEARELMKESNLAINKHGNLYILDGESISCCQIFDQEIPKFTIKKPDELLLVADDFYYIGSSFMPLLNTELFEQEVVHFQNKIFQELYTDQRYLYKKVEDSDSAPFFQYNKYEFYLVTDGLIIIEKRIIQTIYNITWEKDANEQWNCICNKPEQQTFCAYLYSEDKKTVLFEGIKDIKVLAYLYPILIMKVGEEVIYIEKGVVSKEQYQYQQYTFVTTRSGLKYILKKKNYKFSLFLSTELSNPKLQDVDVLNEPFICRHGIVWYKGPVHHTISIAHIINGYSLDLGGALCLNHKHTEFFQLRDGATCKFYEHYFINFNGIIADPCTLTIKDAAIGELIYVSPQLDKVISRRGDQIYLQRFHYETGKYDSMSLSFNRDSYIESYLSPKGDYLVLQKEPNKYTLYDYERKKEMNFFSGKFLAFSKEGSLIVEMNHSRSAKVLDPLTSKDITPPNYHYYRFLSPDGKLYAQLAMKARYYDRVQMKYIEPVAYFKLREQLNGPTSYLVQDRDKVKANLEASRKEYYEQNKQRLKELKIESFEFLSTYKVVQTTQFTEIGIVGTHTTVEIPFPEDLVYYNYAAFSSDNKFFGYVGKPSRNGLIHLFRLDFKEKEQKLEIMYDYLSQYPRYASWVCGFSKTGYFATYDSTPDTYIIKVGDHLYNEKPDQQELNHALNQKQSAFLNTHKSWIEIKGKNFLCFSPTGNYMAISNQGYEPLTLGGHGHQESNAIHIAKTEDGKLVYSSLEHGSRIKDDTQEKVVFVSFSEDEKKLMSLSDDGVIIVRNIDLVK